MDPEDPGGKDGVLLKEVTVTAERLPEKKINTDPLTKLSVNGKINSIIGASSNRGNTQTSGSGKIQQEGPGDPGKGNWSTTMAALAISGVLLADDATVVGTVDDVAIPFLLIGAAAADLYKQQPNGAQYTLRANASGLYPVYSWGSTTPTGTKYLNAGDIWKIGETIQYDASTGQQWRYPQSYLNSMNVSFVPEYLGPKTEIVFVQQMKLAQYLYSNRVLPAGNKGLK